MPCDYDLYGRLITRTIDRDADRLLIYNHSAAARQVRGRHMKTAASVLTIIVILAISVTCVSSATPDLRPVGTSQTSCPIIFPADPVVVAPNQPSVADQSTVGVINALCDVTLDFIGCGFLPTSVVLSCDANGDGVSDLSIPLKDITIINGVFFQATIPSLASTPGTAFPLACCGGVASITLSRTVGAGDDNVFGPFTQTVTCAIDLGIRAPVVISASPSQGDCSIGQNVLIPGSCFVLAGGKPNVTSVLAIEVGNSSNVIHANPVSILSNNLVDAFFQIGSSNAGKTFLIYAAGPNGTSRNLTLLPAGAQIGCPLGNEQGVAVTFKCKSAIAGGPGEGAGSAVGIVVTGCRVDRTEIGTFVLSVIGSGIKDGATITVGGKSPKKLRFTGTDESTGTFTQIIAKKKFCESLPGAIVITNPDGTSSAPFTCSAECANQ